MVAMMPLFQRGIIMCPDNVFVPNYGEHAEMLFFSRVVLHEKMMTAIFIIFGLWQGHPMLHNVRRPEKIRRNVMTRKYLGVTRSYLRFNVICCKCLLYHYSNFHMGVMSTK